MINQPFDSSDLDLVLSGSTTEPEWRFAPLNNVTRVERTLKTCPFCGGKAELIRSSCDGWKASCIQCGSSTRETTVIEFAADLWNHR